MTTPAGPIQLQKAFDQAAILHPALEHFVIHYLRAAKLLEAIIDHRLGVWDGGSVKKVLLADSRYEKEYMYLYGPKAALDRFQELAETAATYLPVDWKPKETLFSFAINNNKPPRFLTDDIARWVYFVLGLRDRRPEWITNCHRPLRPGPTVTSYQIVLPLFAASALAVADLPTPTHFPAVPSEPVRERNFGLENKGNIGSSHRLSSEPKPRWDNERRALYYGGLLVKSYRQPAPCQTRILQAFQEEDWPARIDDPLPGALTVKQRLQRLGDAVKGLKNKYINFERDGTGEGILWSPRKTL